MENGFWQGKKVLVTGGASFIGSHLVDALISRGAWVRVADNLSSGKLENIQLHIERKAVEFLHGDLLNPNFTHDAIKGVQIVFHLAADHGGRGYVDLHQVECSTNLNLDSLIFRTCYELEVEKIIFASSACVYPIYKQMNPHEELYLSEDCVGPPYEADNLYGWAKLMAELTLRAYYKQRGMKSASCRYFTVYGPRGVENHAIMAMIARAFRGQNPFEVWGDGTQIRNWTYVDDIVRGTVMAAERIDDGAAVNLGTMERILVADAAKEVLHCTGHQAEIVFRPDMPTGPLNRVADNSLAKKLLGWEPEVPFLRGLHQTIDWYFNVKNKDEVNLTLDRMLTER